MFFKKQKVISSFKDEYRFLSNFIGGVEIKYQAAKCKNYKDAELILACNEPRKAKKLGRKVEIKDNWNDIKLGIMFSLVEEKFFTNLNLAESLLKTEDSILIEGNNWHDNYWGNCTCNNCSSTFGKNWLGRILMITRSKLLIR